ncbi:MAG: glycosyltransferase family 39 protein [Acidobacteriota bacterium]
MTDSLLSRRGRLALGAAALGYAALLLYRFRTAPDGLVNDTAEEMLKGLALVEGRRLEVMTSTLGYSAETLWLYVMGLSATLLGPTVAAAVIPSAVAVALTALAAALLVRALEPGASLATGFLLAAGSPWLFHYGRSGLRVAAAAFFCALTGLLLTRACRAPERPRGFFVAGAAAALGTYVYTTCRALPVALLAAVAWSALRAAPRDRPAARKAALAALAGALLVSLPNLAFIAAHPHEFLERGRYVYVGGGGDRAANVRATLALPFGFPDAYRGQAGTGAAFDADGVSATFSTAGLNPLPLWVTFLAGIGLVRTLRGKWEGPEVFLLGTLALALAVLAPAGPSLSRLLILAPVLLAFAGRGTAALQRFLPRRAALPALLALGGAFSIGAYFKALGGPDPPPFVAQAATAIGERARGAAARGPVSCVVSRDASVVRYLAHGTPATVIEFFGVPFDPRKAAPRPDVATILVERNPAFDAWTPDGFREAPFSGRARLLERAIP